MEVLQPEHFSGVNPTDISCFCFSLLFIRECGAFFFFWFWFFFSFLLCQVPGKHLDIVISNSADQFKPVVATVFHVLL